MGSHDSDRVIKEAFQSSHKYFVATTMKILKFFVLSLSMIGIANLCPAVANLLGGYVFDGDPQPVAQKRTLSSGSRSDCQSQLNKGDIALAVPDEEIVHLTTKKNPSVYLISNQASSLPFKFTLVDPESSKVVTEKNLHLKGQGIQEITLDNSVNLLKGKTYLWYVAFPCQNNPEESYDILGAGIKKTVLSEEVASALKAAKNPTEKAALFASNGIWYEALELAVQNSNNSANYLQRLLESAGVEYSPDTNTAQNSKSF